MAVEIELEEEVSTEAEAEAEQVEETEGEQEAPEATEAEASAEESSEDELHVQIGDEESPPQEETKEAPEWVKNLRQQYKEAQRELKELRAKTASPAVESVTLPAKPRLDQFDYDEDKFSQAMDGWYAKKAEYDRREAELEAQRKAQQDAIAKVHERYQESKSALKVKDFDEVEEEVIAHLPEVYQGLILQAADNPGLVVYALGKNPKKLAELASIKDPVKFAASIGKLEKDLKVTKGKSSVKPAPEKTVRSTVSASASQAQLDRLRQEALKTGDVSKVLEYKRQMKKAS
jgi:hypothetical protein